jgi:hypothetical protein
MSTSGAPRPVSWARHAIGAGIAAITVGKICHFSFTHLDGVSLCSRLYSPADHQQLCSLRTLRHLKLIIVVTDTDTFLDIWGCCSSSIRHLDPNCRVQTGPPILPFPTGCYPFHCTLSGCWYREPVAHGNIVCSLITPTVLVSEIMFIPGTVQYTHREHIHISHDVRESGDIKDRDTSSQYRRQRMAIIWNSWSKEP